MMSQGDPIRNPPNQKVFGNLPLQIIFDILVKLPIRTIISFKCVCKSWLRLIETQAFVKSHLSRSVPLLAICHKEGRSNVYRIFEIEDRFNSEHLELFQNPLTEFNLPYRGWLHGSANGFLFLCDKALKPHGLYVFNPITRDFITLHCPQKFALSDFQHVTYGFGMSKITGQLKLVRICQNDRGFGERPIKSACQVYTLGTRSWRRVAPGPLVMYGDDISAAFINGNLHWLVFDANRTPWISCFDLEADLFSIFPTPTIPNPERFMVNVFVVGDSLCVCDNTSEDEIVIWSMKEYGVESSWRKEFVISRAAFTPNEYNGCPFRINLLKDGEILIGWQCDVILLFYCFNKDGAARKVDMFKPDTFIDCMVYTPRFLHSRVSEGRM